MNYDKLYMKYEVKNMSAKEEIIKLLDEVPETEMGKVLSLIQSIVDEERADDEFCEKLYQEYLNSDDYNDNDEERVTIEELCKECGVQL